jgi:hypothetical protein
MTSQATDIFGSPVRPGDVVATLVPAPRRGLRRATVVAITPKMLRVRVEGASRESMVFQQQVAKRGAF